MPEAVQDAVSDEAWLRAMLDVEVALSRALTAHEIISPAASTAISAARPDLDGIGVAARDAGNPVVELVRRLRQPKPEASGQPRHRSDPDLERVEEELRRSLGTKVSLARSRRGGRIVIEYYSEEELGRLYERLTGGTA